MQQKQRNGDTEHRIPNDIDQLPSPNTPKPRIPQWSHNMLHRRTALPSDASSIRITKYGRNRRWAPRSEGIRANPATRIGPAVTPLTTIRLRGTQSAHAPRLQVQESKPLVLLWFSVKK